MSLQVDRRTGSVELAEPLQARGLPVEIVELGFGDFSWLGHGPEGLVPIGVELKTFGDLLSCIVNGRFAAHQLPGLNDSYEFWWLLVEGDWQPRKDGQVVVNGRAVKWGRREWHYRAVQGWIFSMAHQGGAWVWQTRRREETLQWLHCNYSWWTSEEWKEHRAVKALHRVQVDTGTFARPSREQYVAAAIGHGLGLGNEFALAAAREFKTIRAMLEAEEGHWAELKAGKRRLGGKVAKRIVEAIG